MKRFAFAMVCMLALPAQARDLPPPTVAFPDQPLTLDDALRLFRQRGLDLLIAEAAIWGAEGDVKAAGAVPNPNVSVGLYKSFFNPGLFETDLGWFVGLGDSNAIEDSLSGKRGLRLKVARAALAAAKQSRMDAQRTLEYQVKQQFIQAVLARDSLDFALEVQKTATQTFDLNTVRYNAGAISEADVAKVETAKLEADQAVDQAAQALRVAKVGLAFLLGVRGPVPDFHVQQDLPKFVVPQSLAIATRDSLLDSAFRLRPDLRSQQAQRERSRAQLALNKRLRFPDIALNLEYSQQGSSSGAQVAGSPPMTITPIAPPTLQVSLAGTLPVFYFQQGEIARAESDVRTQDLQRAKIEAQVVNDVESAWTNFLSTRKLVERMETRLLDRAKRARDLVEIQFRKGAASLLEYLDAQRTYISTNLEYLQDLTNYWTAVYQLEQAVGTDLR
jgi:cobalt-zinc-cadmium efflux system outer membrane protein